MKDFLKWGLIGLVGYWVYENFFATTTTTTTGAATTPAVNTGFDSLANIYLRMIQDAVNNTPGTTQATITLTADQWNYYLARQSSVTPAAPAAVFGATYTANPDATMTAAQYWAVMDPYLVTQGMSGLGLYRGMGRFYQRGRFA
jgi:hypothetical protein